MIFKTKKLERSLIFLNETRDGIISYCKMNHPDEMILILKASAVGGGRDTPLEMSCRAAATYAKQLLDERN